MQITTNGVHAVLARYGLNSAPDHSRRHRNPLLLHPFTCMRVVLVGPPLDPRIPPGQRFLRDHSRSKFVISQYALPFGSITQRKQYVAQIAEGRATVVAAQA